MGLRSGDCGGYLSTSELIVKKPVCEDLSKMAHYKGKDMVRNSSQLGCGVSVIHTHTHTLLHHQQPEQLLQGRMKQCFRVVSNFDPTTQTPQQKLGLIKPSNAFLISRCLILVILCEL